MSQLTALYEETETTGVSQWWSVSIKTGADLELADAVVSQIIAPLAAQARVLGAERWFFDRWIDESGVQIRAQFRGSQSTVDRLQRFHGALLGQLPRDIGRLHTDHHLVGADSCQAFQPAGQMLEVSSDLAVWASGRFPKMQSRSALAALLLADSARAMLRGPRSGQWPDRRRLPWDDYWDSHLKWRTADLGQNGSRIRATLVEQISTKAPPMHCLMAATAVDSAVQTWRRRWSGSIDTFLYRSNQAQTSRSAHQLTLHQGHMLLNQLGFTAREEAILGLHARSWTADKENQLVEANRS